MDEKNLKTFACFSLACEGKAQTFSFTQQKEKTVCTLASESNLNFQPILNNTKFVNSFLAKKISDHIDKMFISHNYVVV